MIVTLQVEHDDKIARVRHMISDTAVYGAKDFREMFRAYADFMARQMLDDYLYPEGMAE